MPISKTEKSILKTVACYEALGQYPLTAVEIYRYLQKENSSGAPPNLLEVTALLTKSSVLSEYLQGRNGFFFFKNDEDLYRKRIYKYKTSSSKWRKIRRLGTFLSLVPFFRGVAINGSMAIDNAGPKSDIDFLVFAKQGRIWMCRLLLSFFLQILGQRRHGRLIANKICLNHYIAQPSYFAPIHNAPNAQLYCRLVPLTNYAEYESFQKENLSWLKNFLFFPAWGKTNHLKRIDEDGLIFKIAKRFGLFFEFILELAGAGIMERMLGSWQKKRILEKTKHRPLGRDELLLSDSMLVFHYPICKNRAVVRAYTQRLNFILDPI